MFCSSNPVLKITKPKKYSCFTKIDTCYSIVIVTSSFLGGTYVAYNTYVATRDLHVSKFVAETTLAFICGIPFGLITGILSPIILPVSTVVFIIRCLDTKKGKQI